MMTPSLMGFWWLQFHCIVDCADAKKGGCQKIVVTYHPPVKHKGYSGRVLQLNPKDLVQILVLLLISCVTLGEPHQLYNPLFSYLSSGLAAHFCMPNHETHSLTIKTAHFMCLLIPVSIQAYGPWIKKHSPFDIPFLKIWTALMYTPDIS